MRYEEYKKSEYDWLPEIPAHWQQLYIQQVSHEQKNKNIGMRENLVLSLSYGQIIRKKNVDAGLVAKDLSTYQIVDKDNIILRFTDLQNDHKSLRTGLVKERGIITAAYTCIVPTINAAYLHYVLHSYDTRKVFYGMGGGVRQSIGFDDIRHMYVPVPPRKEQDQIVRYLDWKVSCINKLIHGYQRQLDLVEERWRTIENHVCLNGLHKVALKDSGNKWIGNIPYGWETIKLGQFCSFQNGISESGDFFTDGSPFVNYSDVYRHLELPENVSGTAKSNEKQQKIYSVQEGDIFFTRTSENIEEAGMAAVCLHTIANAVFSGFLIRCRPTKNIVDTNFIKYYLQIPAVRNHFSSTMNIVTRASVGQYLLRQLAVVVPPMEEQHEIADYLDDESRKYERIKRNIQHEVALLKEYRTRLISDVVTGQMDVRGVVIPDYTPEDDTDENEADEEQTDEEVSMDAD